MFKFFWIFFLFFKNKIYGKLSKKIYKTHRLSEKEIEGGKDNKPDSDHEKNKQY